MRNSRFSEEQIIRLLKEADAGRRVTDLFRVHEISQITLYRWKSKYSGMDVSDARKRRELEDENRRLKQLVAEQSLDVQVLKAALESRWSSPTGRRRWCAYFRKPVGAPSLAGLGLLLMLSVGCGDFAANREAKARAHTSRQIVFNDVHYERKEGNRLVVSYAAREVVWRKRRFGVISIAPLKEVVLHDVRMSLRFEPREAEGGSDSGTSSIAGFRDALVGWAAAGQLPGVTRVRVASFRLELLEDERVLFTVQAEQASVGSHRTLVLGGDVSVLTRSGERLRASRAWLDDRVLVVRGSYGLSVDPLTERRGKDTSFELARDGTLRIIDSPLDAHRNNGG